MNDIGGVDQGAVDTAQGSEGGMLELLQVARVLQSRIETALESVGLSIPKYQALEELVGADGPVSLSVLADRHKCVRSNITQLIDRLEADGLAKRVDDPADRRAVRAAATPLGAERFAAATEALQQVERELTSGVSREDRSIFRRVLAALRTC